MTMPDVTPLTVGLQPRSADEVNATIGQHLRNFSGIKNTINQDHDFLAATDLKVPPYNFSADQETLIKSAIADLDASLDAVDMTFITRLIGLY
jgi:hypothetical protein